MTLTVTSAAGVKIFDADDLPLAIGDSGTHVPIPGFDGDGAAAFLGRDGDDIFIQPVDDPGPPVPVGINGVALTASRWLEDGDRITVGPAFLRVEKSAGGVNIVVEAPTGEKKLHEGSREDLRFEPAPDSPPISPSAFTPRHLGNTSAGGLRIRRRTVAAALIVAILMFGAWYVLTASSVTVITEPPAEELRVSEGFAPGFRGRYLLRPGTYRVRAERSGYLPLDETFDVARGASPAVLFNLEPLGASVSVRSEPVSDATVTVDGVSVGTTPLTDLPLAAGSHSIEVTAPLHRAYTTDLSIEPGHPPISLVAELEPNWAPLALATTPSGAEVIIDAETVGTTPINARIEAGTRSLQLRLPRYKPVRRQLELVAGQGLDLGVIRLIPEDGTLGIESRPSGATVTIGSQYRGTTPLELTVPPDTPLEVRVSLTGHSTHTTEVAVASGRRRVVQADLEMLSGRVSISSQPPGAEVVIDGEVAGLSGQTLELDARPHEVEVRLDGYVPFRTTITPEPGLTQAVRATLKLAGPAGLPRSVTTSQGVEMVLVEPGSFTMGASRREPGRRANEVLREVEITRHFYLAVREVSNSEFREFKKEHLSGSYGGHNLEIDHHPVVNVTWEDAARYCNWLSQKEGLPPVYVERGGALTPRRPMPTGYRLPTEAEWAWAARYAGSASPTKYAWGEGLPVPQGAGNYGDASAEAALRGAIPGYRDGHPATAPVGSYSANELGVFNLGGNVAEWVQDLYAFAPSGPGDVNEDPLGPTTGTEHVIRGASWMDTAVTELRLTYRDHGNRQRPDLGFRLARSAQ